MRFEFAVALLASTALHAGVLFYTPPGVDSRTETAKPDLTNPGVVIVAHLKNTLDAGDASRARNKSGEGPGASAARKPHLDNPMQFYPPEAIAKGIEGETILILRYRPDGTLLDAKVARSSGHAILDQAALRAVRVTARTTDGPREVLFPVTFALQ